MKIVFHREALLAKLKKALTFVPKKPLLPAYETFLFEIQDGILNITAMDGEKQITLWVEALKSDGNGRFTIPAKLLTNTVNLLLEPEITFVYKDSKVEVKCGKSKYKMYCDDGSTYPKIKAPEATFEASFTGASFNEAIETAKRYANAENPAAALQGICFRINDSKFNVFGANNHSMTKIVTSPRSINKWEDILIFVSAANSINKCVDDGDIVDISHNQKAIEIRTDAVSIICLAIDAKYPDVDEFFKKKGENFLTLNTLQFLHALQRADQYTEEESPIVAVDIKTSHLSIIVNNSMFNRDGVEEIDCVSAKEAKIGLNSKLLLNVMESFTSDQFNLYYKDSGSPVFIEPANTLKDNNFFFLVAPIKI